MSNKVKQTTSRQQILIAEDRLTKYSILTKVNTTEKIFIH
jgi:hypothetical protein